MPPLPEDPAPADPTPAPNPAPADPAPGEPKTYDEAYVKQLRSEAAENRKARAAAEARLKELDDAKLSETEKLAQAAKEATARATAAEERVKASLGKAAVQVAAVKLQVVDPDVAYTLIQSKLEFDADGNPTNTEALLAQLVKDKPYLLAGAATTTSATNPASSRSGPPSGNGKRLPTWGEVFKR